MLIMKHDCGLRILQAIDRLPLVPGLLELVGIGYTGVSSFLYPKFAISFLLLILSKFFRVPDHLNSKW